MKFFVYTYLFCFVVFSCSRKTSAQTSAAVAGIPLCIQHKIDSIKQHPVWNPPAEIDEYFYGGRKVYVISARCCDLFSVAVDENCNYLCAPSGGFTGKGDRKCVDFSEKAKFIRCIWKDERKSK